MQRARMSFSFMAIVMHGNGAYRTFEKGFISELQFLEGTDIIS